MRDIVMLTILTLRGGIILGIAIAAIGIAFHAFLPRKTIIVISLLMLIETVCGILYVNAEFQRSRTGLEVLSLLPIALAILLGNLLAVPIARKLRTGK